MSYGQEATEQDTFVGVKIKTKFRRKRKKKDKKETSLFLPRIFDIQLRHVLYASVILTSTGSSLGKAYRRWKRLDVQQ